MSNIYKMREEIDTSKAPPAPKPSASVLLVSPENHILLLQRVKTSSAFPSAHVFPGGNVSTTHDGSVPGPAEPGRHEDGPAYRLAAVRETFEESGLLLAKNSQGRLLAVSDKEREDGRKRVHKGEVKFVDWLKEHGGMADTDGLIPCTRWITPVGPPKRFTTQMYIYFLPLAGTSSSPSPGTSTHIPSASDTETVIPIPTHDGGIEHTAARFLPAWKWISMSQQNRVILFPPQFYLLHLVAPFLSPQPADLAKAGSRAAPPPDVLALQRKRLVEYVRDPATVPSWAERCISPSITLVTRNGKKSLLLLHSPGDELKGSGRSGDSERVVLVKFKKEGPRELEIRWKKDVLEEESEFRELVAKQKL